ncbi:MAG: V-type ATP synthase subunit F [Candidatus Methanomethylophilaceae archaeon]|nr:V-type ATP synthase subunit F [Candidatus Methanomethylophilaceae archaeon]
MDIAVIGSDEFVLGFRLAGLRCVFVATPENYQEVMLKAMEEPDIGVLAADGKDLDLLTPQVKARVMDSIQPVVVPVGRGETDLREKGKRAIGVDLYKEDE